MHDSFYVGNDHVKLAAKRVWIPKLGWVRMREELRFRGKLVSAVVSRTADKWVVSLSVELEETPERCESQAAVGVDLGIIRLASGYGCGRSFGFEASWSRRSFLERRTSGL